MSNAKKALMANQLAAFFAQLGQQYNYFNPGARTMSDSLLGNAQSEIMRLNQEIEAEKAKKKTLFGDIGAGLGFGATVAAAPFTGGMSLLAAPMATSAGYNMGSGIENGNMGQAFQGMAGLAGTGAGMSGMDWGMPGGNAKIIGSGTGSIPPSPGGGELNTPANFDAFASKNLNLSQPSAPPTLGQGDTGIASPNLQGNDFYYNSSKPLWGGV